MVAPVILDSMTKVLRIVLGEAKTTSDCEIVSSWAETSSSVFLGGNTNIHSNGTTPVIVVPAPNNPTVVRDVREVRLYNADTVSHTVTLQLYDGTTAWHIAPAVVSVVSGGSFIYTPEAGITVLGSGGSGASGPASGDLSGTYPSPSVVALAGQPLGSTTAGSGNLLIGSGTQWVSHSITGDWTITAGGASTVAKVNGVSYGASPATNTFPLVTGANTVTYTATSQIPGSTTNDSASAGNIGEFISSTVLAGAAVPLSNATAANVTSVSATGGDWDAQGEVCTSTGGSTVTTQVVGWISTVSATLPTAPNSGALVSLYTPATTGLAVDVPVGTMRQSLAGTTSVFLEAFSAFSASTSSAFGFISTRRRR